LLTVYKSKWATGTPFKATRSRCIGGKNGEDNQKNRFLPDFSRINGKKTYLLASDSDNTSFSIATLLLAWPVFVS
jgi:hypothetical protein